MTVLFRTYSRKTRRLREVKRGAVMVVSLVCLVVVMALIGGMLQGTLRARRQLHSERDRRQAELLLQAGLQRAAFRLAHEGDYRGETWKIPAEVILGTSDGQVTIEVSQPTGDKLAELKISAEYRVGDAHSICRSATFTVKSPTIRKSE